MSIAEQLVQTVGSYFDAIEDRFAVKEFAIVENESELLAQLGQEESFETVFNSWLRFSRNSSQGLANLSALPDELTAWQYDTGTNQIVCTINSSSYIGFISPDSYDNYVFEVIFNSSDNDDDDIGLVAALAQDAQGNYHTLDLVRSGRGNAPMRIFKNFQMSSNQTVLHNVLSGLTWIDGEVATEPSPNNSRSPGWSRLNEGVLCKISRVGDIITFETSQFDDISGYHEPATRIVDLSSDPNLEVFRGPQQFGYSCFSQNQSTWEVLRRPGARVPVLDLENGKVHAWDGDDWTVSDFTGVPELLRDKTFYVNSLSGKMYYVDSRLSSVIKVG